MRKRTLVFTAVFLVGTMLFATTALGAQAQRNIKAFYRDIKLKVNGQIVNSGNVEPFLYNDTVYVPIRLVSTALNKNVNWDNNNHTVIITDKVDQVKVNQEVANLKQQLAAKDSELNTLRLQNSFLNSRIIDLEKTVSDYKYDDKKTKDRDKDDAEDYLKDYLEDEYSKWNKIKFKYKVRESRGDITLTIEFDRRDYRSEWDRLTERKIEKWLEDIYDYLKDEFPKAGFEGEIRDTDERETLVEFSESRNKLKVEFKDSKEDLDDLENDLNRRYGSRLDGYDRDFGNLKADIRLRETRYDDEFELTIEVDTSRYDVEWSRVRNTKAVDNWIDDIVKEIQKEYRRSIINGTIKDYKGKTEADFDVSSSGNISWSWR